MEFCFKMVFFSILRVPGEKATMAALDSDLQRLCPIGLSLCGTGASGFGIDQVPSVAPLSEVVLGAKHTGADLDHNCRPTSENVSWKCYSTARSLTLRGAL